ncbi:MAG: AAA family ATPase, partial [Dehalococcoidia bacterium]
MTNLSKDILTLKTAEALAKDVGRAIARIDPDDMAKMDIHVGDIVQISGKRATLVKSMPAFAEQRGHGTIQIDGISRENAQIGIGEKVKISKVQCNTAGSIILAPLTSSEAFVREKDRKYLGRLIEGLPVTVGDKIRATFLGSGYQEFSVLDTAPKGAVVIGPQTTIKVKGEA